jgi:metal-sulfur cluster biosynthetic enzyme
MTQVTPDQIYELLATVGDPCAIETTNASVVDMGVITDITCDGPIPVITVSPTTGLCPHSMLMVANVKKAVLDSGLVDDVSVELAFGKPTRPRTTPLTES